MANALSRPTPRGAAASSRTAPDRRPARGPGSLLALSVALALTAAASGCQSGASGPIARWRAAKDSSLSRPPSAAEVGDSRGLLASWFSPKVEQTNIAEVLGLASRGDASRALQPVAPNPEAEAELQAAMALFEQKDYVRAEEAFKKIARRRKDTSWGEKAQFHLAETQFLRGKLVAAHDSFEVLFAKYPGTRYLDHAVRREYEIAQDWMAAFDPEAPAEKKPSVPDWWNGRHPAVDLSGHALAVLEHVRHHDPLGPLADDAAMGIADYHFNAGNYEDASYYYDQLITEHPKSDLLRRAHAQSIESKLKAYIGPDYDGAGLEEARKLVLQTMTLFPEQQASYSEEMYHRLALIEDQLAERAYRRGEHYLWTGKVTSAEYSFGEIPTRWPKSPWAERAQAQLATIATMPRTETRASRLMSTPNNADPLTGGGGTGAGALGGSGGIPGLNGLGGLGGP